MCLNSCLYFLYLELSKLEEKSSKDISEIIPNIRQALLNVSSLVTTFDDTETAIRNHFILYHS
mgnify:CR=1 FL=1